MIYGPLRLVSDLRDLGHDAVELQAPDGTPFAVVHGFVVLAGKFADRSIDLGIQATPDFPISVASAIHVRATPQLYNRGDAVADVRNITTSVLGDDWCYWSHNFGGHGAQSTRRLMSQINRIFFNAA